MYYNIEAQHYFLRVSERVSERERGRERERERVYSNEFFSRLHTIITHVIADYEG